MIWFYGTNVLKFQSTHPHGVRQRLFYIRHYRDCFNPRTHTGCDALSLTLDCPWTCFNPRTHTGCDIFFSASGPNHSVFQSTHPHGVRLRVPPATALALFVSIHAPTRGATSSSSISSDAYMFQSTHPHGVRRYSKVASFSRNEFQSTHPHGVRRRCISRPHRLLAVSIHAPTRGATQVKTYRVSVLHPFQSTHPHGVRQAPHKDSLRLYRFNPRTHTGCDNRENKDNKPNKGFNPRTHTGCDHPSPCCHSPLCCFNPRTHTGCDSANIGKLFDMASFNPRTHTGCDVEYVKIEMHDKLFQSTHPHGVRPSLRSCRNTPVYVSIHAPTRGATPIDH